MTQPLRIACYSDLHCPYAYVNAYRLRQLRTEYAGQIEIVYKSLALEYRNNQPTPKGILDNETAALMLEEPEIPYQPWHAPLNEWPVTMWPAFEAVKCAERQGLHLAAELDWSLRVAFFDQSRCISMRHVLFTVAERAGLDMRQFANDFDSGITKAQVLREAQEGWEELRVEASPTLVLPNGKQYSYRALGLPRAILDPKRHYRLVEIHPGSCKGAACLDIYHNIFQEALQAQK